MFKNQQGDHFFREYSIRVLPIARVVFGAYRHAANCATKSMVGIQLSAIIRNFYLGMKNTFITVLVGSVLAIVATSQAIAGPHFNDGGLGCGTIVSLRESTQKPLPTELADEYGGISYSTDGTVHGVLASQGVMGMAAVAGDLLFNAVRATAEAKSNEARKAQEAATAKYKNVQAIEFKFDDGEIINVLVMVVSGMRYKAGRRINAMISPRYGNIALGNVGLFSGIPDVGDSNYNGKCRIDDPVARKALLDKVRYLVDEQQIVDPEERRPQAIIAKVEEVAVPTPIVVKENPSPEDLPPWPPESAPAK